MASIHPSKRALAASRDKLMNVNPSVKCWISLDAGAALFFNLRSRPAKPFNMVSNESHGGDGFFRLGASSALSIVIPFWDINP